MTLYFLPNPGRKKNLYTLLLLRSNDHVNIESTSSKIVITTMAVQCTGTIVRIPNGITEEVSGYFPVNFEISLYLELSMSVLTNIMYRNQRFRHLNCDQYASLQSKSGKSMNSKYIYGQRAVYCLLRGERHEVFVTIINEWMYIKKRLSHFRG